MIFEGVQDVQALLGAANSVVAHTRGHDSIISTEVPRVEQVQRQLEAGITVAGPEASKRELRGMATGKHGGSGLAMEPEPNQGVLNEGISRAGSFFK
jgi:hypothetical protein